MWSFRNNRLLGPVDAIVAILVCIVVALKEAIRLMKEIDQAIPTWLKE
jgi:hypothetical protein